METSREDKFIMMSICFNNLKKDVERVLEKIVNTTEVDKAISCEPEDGWEFFLIVKINDFKYRVGVGPGYYQGRFCPKYKFQTYNDDDKLIWKTFTYREMMEEAYRVDFITSVYRKGPYET